MNRRLLTSNKSVLKCSNLYNWDKDVILMVLTLREEINRFDVNITTEIPFGYGENVEWIGNLGSITQIVDNYKSDRPMVILCSVPAKLQQKKEECSLLQLQFLEAVEIMRECDCNILSTAGKYQFKEQCQDGHQILEDNGIFNSIKFCNYGQLWYERDLDNKPIPGTRSYDRVVNALKDRICEENKITFIIFPGSLRIADAIAVLILRSTDLGKVYAIDAESPIDTIRKNTLTYWGRDIEEFVYISGQIFIGLDPLIVSRTLLTKSIVLMCIFETYNTDPSTPIMENILKKLGEILPDDHRIMITYPGEEEGVSLKYKNFKGISLKNEIHYTIIIDQYKMNYCENNQNKSEKANYSELNHQDMCLWCGYL